MKPRRLQHRPHLVAAAAKLGIPPSPQPRLPAVRPHQPEQHPQRRGLARAVGAEETSHARPELETEPVNRRHPAELGTAIEHATTAGSGGLGDVEKHFAAYLDAEKKLGRIAADADTQTLAFALLGSVHHLTMTNPAGLPDLHGRVDRIVTALVAGMHP